MDTYECLYFYRKKKTRREHCVACAPAPTNNMVSHVEIYQPHSMSQLCFRNGWCMCVCVCGKVHLKFFGWLAVRIGARTAHNKESTNAVYCLHSVKLEHLKR